MSNSEPDPIMVRIIVVFVAPHIITDADYRNWLLTGERPESAENKEYGVYAS